MPEIARRDRLQPCLLDRLTDREPDQRAEAPERRVMSLRRWRASVVRDIDWLLNTVHLQATEDLTAYPEIQCSVLNYGIPDLAGKTASSSDVRTIEKAVSKAIREFEPRLMHKVNVTVRIDTEDMSQSCLAFDIEGELWAVPDPTHLLLQTQVDLETGNCVVSEQGGTTVSAIRGG